MTSFCMSVIRCAATASSAMPDGLRPLGDDRRDSPPVRAFHSVSVTNGITGCSSLQQRVEHRGQHRGGVRDVPSASCTLASSTYQSQNSSQAKW